MFKSVLFRSLSAGLFAITVVATTAIAQPAATQPVGRPDNRVRFCGFGGGGDTLDMLMAYWPNLDYCRAYDANNVRSMRELGEAAKARGVRYTLQAAAPVMPDGYLDKHNAWSIDFLNRKPPELGFGHPAADYCHPATLAAMRANLDVTRDVGASSMSMVDFVWPWVGGNWGYSQACIAAYRAALADTDGGLRTIDADDTEKTLTFWDYFAELSGLRFKPQDLGYATWQEYDPARPNKMGEKPSPELRRNAFVFRGLNHYCWLRYAQDSGAYAKSIGLELQASLNPENMANGTDLLMWGRLKDTGEPWMEQWGSPLTAIAGYYNYRYFMEPYHNGKKRLGLIAETGAAGGHPADLGFGPARPHYWDPNSNYAITWAISAAGKFDDREEDYIYASPQETLDPAGPQADTWRGYVKGMDGFWQYALDKPTRPVAPILSIVNRSVLHNNDTSESSIGQLFSLAPPLVDAHIDFEQGYFPLSDTMLAGRKLLLFAPWDYPRDVMPRLVQWLAADKSRVFVTHSFVPARPCKGLSSDPVPEIDEPAAAELLGLRGLKLTDVRAGKINAIDPEWKDAFKLPAGTEIKLDRPLVAAEGRALVKLGDAPLVTRVQTPNGGAVIYLNFTPPERYETDKGDVAKLTRAVMEAIARKADIAPQADGAAQWAVSRYDLTDGHAFLLLDRKQLKHDRFTEETPSYDNAEKLFLRLNPKEKYVIYDVLADTLATRRADDAGRLEIFTAGRSIRLLYLSPAGEKPMLTFTTCERRDARPRTELPAKLYAHRAGKAVVSGIPKGATVYLNGKPAPLIYKSLEDGKTVVVDKGEHVLEVR